MERNSELQKKWKAEEILHTVHIVHSVANLVTLSLDLATFQTPLATLKKYAPSNFWENLSNFPNVASTVLRAQDLELPLSLCLLWSVSARS